MLNKIGKCDPLLIGDINVKYGINSGDKEVKFNDATIIPSVLDK